MTTLYHKGDISFSYSGEERIPFLALSSSPNKQDEALRTVKERLSFMEALFNYT